MMTDAQRLQLDTADDKGFRALVSLADTAARIHYGQAPDKVKPGWLQVSYEAQDLAAAHLVNTIGITHEQAARIIVLWMEE